MRRSFNSTVRGFIIVLAMAAVFAAANPVQAGPTALAAMGDSLTATNTYTWSWTPWLVNRGLSFGTSYAYNVAEGGATSATLISTHQDTRVRDWVAAGNVDVPVMMIGGNDFLGIVTQLASGTLSGTALTNTLNTTVNNIVSATDTVRGAHPDGFILCSVPNVLAAPALASVRNDPNQAQRVINATNYVNGQLKAAAIARGAPFIDLAALTSDIINSPLVVGGVTISTSGYGTDPTYFCIDEIHPGTIGHGLMANLVIKTLNDSYHMTYAMFTDQEMLTIAGIGGQYTGETYSNTVDMGQYITVPEPVTFSLISLAVLPLIARRRRSLRR